jgi:hypothetical protein
MERVGPDVMADGKAPRPALPRGRGDGDDMRACERGDGGARRPLRLGWRPSGSRRQHRALELTPMNGATSPMTVLGICGSLRRGSLNRAVLNALPELAPDGMKVEIAPSIADFPLYNADLQKERGFPQPVVALKERVAAADGVVFVSP